MMMTREVLKGRSADVQHAEAKIGMIANSETRCADKYDIGQDISR